MSKTKFAIVGCGRISESHIAAIKKAPSAELVALCDIKEEAVLSACRTCGVEKYYTDLDEMLKNEKIDVLNICTPSGMHAEHAIKAMNSGVNVLCEKPLDITKEKLDAMIAASKENAVLLGGIFQRRNASGICAMKEKYDKGDFGDTVFINSIMHYYRSDEYYKSDAWRGTMQYDRGCLMNQCIHGIDSLLYIAGDVQSVIAKCQRREKKIECEDTAAAIIKFKNGAMGVIEATTCVNPGQDTIITISGNRGSATVGDKGFYAWDFTDGSESPKIKEGDFGGKNCGWAGEDLHAILIEDMANAVKEKRKPMIAAEDARRAVDLILAIYESSETGREVFLTK